MNETEALAKMYSPQDRRPGKPHGGVMQIIVTSSCNLSCFNCTQGSNLKITHWMMSPEQFEDACISLKGYFGTIGVFGGCPTTSKYFPDYCKMLQKHFPKDQCGLWANNLFGHGAICRDTFNPSRSNLNVHLDREAYKEFARDWPESRPFGLNEDSRHSPVFVAMKDVVEDEAERWELISNCDINKHWSAMIGVFRNELRGWFCEIAGAQSMLHQYEDDYPDTGVEITGFDDLVGGGVNPFWWQQPMESNCFSAQVRKHCHECSVPLRGHGELAQAENGSEQVSKTHAAIYKPKKKERLVQLVDNRSQLAENPNKRVTKYLGVK